MLWLIFFLSCFRYFRKMRYLYSQEWNKLKMPCNRYLSDFIDDISTENIVKSLDFLAQMLSLIRDDSVYQHYWFTKEAILREILVSNWNNHEISIEFHRHGHFHRFNCILSATPFHIILVTSYNNLVLIVAKIISCQMNWWMRC